MPSPVWQYFEKVGDGSSVKCSRCGKIYKFNKSTTSLSNHLKNAHKIEVRKENASSEVGNSDQAEPFSGPLDKCVRYSTAFGVDGHKNKAVQNALLYMIAKDNMPLRTPQREGFRMFCKTLQPLYKPPSVITLTNDLHAKYIELAAKVKNELSQAYSVCLTTDLWTHNHTMQSYLGVTAHYLQGTTIKSVELGAYPMDERKFIENLRPKLRGICDEWGLDDDKISQVLSDGGPNIKAAIKQEFGEYRHITCFGHTLNNIGQRIIENNVSAKVQKPRPAEIPESSGDEFDSDDSESSPGNSTVTPLRELLKKVKSIVRFFRSSEVASKELKALQMEGGNSKCLKLIQEVPTRWNTCFEMADRFLILADPIGRVLLQVHRDKSSRSKPPNMLTGDELEALADVREVLKPLWSITQEVSAEKSVTLSKCIPLVTGLKIKVNRLSPSTLIGRKIKDKLSAEIQEKFHSIESVRAFAVATLLDPRFKKLPFQNIRESSRAISYIGEMVDKEIHNARSSVMDSEEAEAQDVVATDPEDIWFFLDVSASNNNRHARIEEDSGIPIQLKHFLASPTVNRKANPNPFAAWQVIENEYPYIWKIAKKFLPIMATSVPCERLFSHAGLIATQLRSRLSPQHVNMLVFLHSLDENIWFSN